MGGELSILNVGDGDTKLVFDGEEAEKSAAIVTDMIRRGFVLLIEVGRNDSGPIYQRAKGFDPKTLEYIVAGQAAEESVVEEAQAEARPERPSSRKAPRPSSRGKAAGTRRIPASTAKAVGVSRTAGG